MPQPPIPSDILELGGEGIPDDLFALGGKPVGSLPKSQEQSKGFLDTLSSYLDMAPKPIQRLIKGPLPEDVAAHEQFNLSHGLSSNSGRLITGTESPLPEMSHDPNEGWGPYLAKGAYNQFVRPLASPMGMIGASTPSIKGAGNAANLASRLEAICFIFIS